MKYCYRARYRVWLDAYVEAEDREEAGDKALEKFGEAFGEIESVIVVERDFEDGELDEVE